MENKNVVLNTSWIRSFFTVWGLKQEGRGHICLISAGNVYEHQGLLFCAILPISKNDLERIVSIDLGLQISFRKSASSQIQNLQVMRRNTYIQYPVGSYCGIYEAQSGCEPPGTWEEWLRDQQRGNLQCEGKRWAWASGGDLVWLKQSVRGYRGWEWVGQEMKLDDHKPGIFKLQQGFGTFIYWAKK